MTLRAIIGGRRIARVVSWLLAANLLLLIATPLLESWGREEEHSCSCCSGRACQCCRRNSHREKEPAFAPRFKCGEGCGCSGAFVSSQLQRPATLPVASVPWAAQVTAIAELSPTRAFAGPSPDPLRQRPPPALPV